MSLKLIRTNKLNIQLNETSSFIRENIYFKTRFIVGDAKDRLMVNFYSSFKMHYIYYKISQEFNQSLEDISAFNCGISCSSTIGTDNTSGYAAIAARYYYDEDYQQSINTIKKLLKIYASSVDLSILDEEKIDEFIKDMHNGYIGSQNAKKLTPPAIKEDVEQLLKRTVSPEAQIDLAYEKELQNYEFYKDEVIKAVKSLDYRIHRSPAKVYRNQIILRAGDVQSRLNDFKDIFVDNYTSGQNELVIANNLILKSNDIKDNSYKIQDAKDSVKVTSLFEGDFDLNTLEGKYAAIILVDCVKKWYFNYIREQKNLIYTPSVLRTYDNIIKISNMTKSPQTLIDEEQVVFTEKWLDQIITQSEIDNNKEALVQSLVEIKETQTDSEAFTTFANERFHGLGEFEFTLEDIIKRRHQAIDKVTLEDVRQLASSFKKVLHNTIGKF